MRKEALSKAQKEAGHLAPISDDAMHLGQRAEQSKIRLMAGGFLDGRAVAAFDCLGWKYKIPVQVAVAQRCFELLSTKSHLVDDLELLAANCPETEHNFDILHPFYVENLRRYEVSGKRLPTISTRDVIETKDLSAAQKLTKIYDVYKKMILWDVLLDHYRT